jgi:adenosylmethionine---8-amino-7-oxononanoate aminotransferase
VMGAIGVIELKGIADIESLRARFVAEGVFIRPFGTTVYLTPAFTISPDELATLMSTVVKVLGER